MPRFLTNVRIKNAVDALSETRAKAVLLDFLILKRSLVLKGEDQVAITQGEPAYIQATTELAAVYPHDEIEVSREKQIFNIFASSDQKGGFRRGKYISNGTGSTIGSARWQSIIELSSDKPRKASLRSDYISHLTDLLLKEPARLEKPNLTEIAIWNYRQTDVDSILGTEVDPLIRGERLQKRLTDDYGLTDDELVTLFDTSSVPVTDDDLKAEEAVPEDYLEGLSKAPQIEEEPASGLPCSVDLVVALASKPFVILTGMSGTGKSRATLKLAEQLQDLYGAEVNAQIFQLVAIGPDWTSPKKLLGYKTPFGSERSRPDGSKTNESYEITETLRIILRASNPKSTKIPHFLIFDEMNLSHVERYFAPFLSLIEASSILDDGASAPLVDRQSLEVISELLDLEDPESSEAESARILVQNEQPLTLPSNLFYVGTVNVDETTYMFSPKVLDRAHVLEVHSLRPSQYISGSAPVATMDLNCANNLLREAIDGRESGAKQFDNPAAILDGLVSDYGFADEEVKKYQALTLAVLDGAYHLLQPVGFDFAFRVVKEVYGYMWVWVKSQLEMGKSPIEALDTWVEGLDRALFQKVLPKIHGNRMALGDSLSAFAAFLDGGDAKAVPAAKYALGAGEVVQIDPGAGLALPEGKSFTQSISKLMAMHRRLTTRNYVSFVR